MGVLGAQPERNRKYPYVECLDDFVAQVAKLAQQSKVSAEAIATLRLSLVLSDIHQTMIEDGDHRDEQAGGFGDLLQAFNGHMEKIALAVDYAVSDDEGIAHKIACLETTVASGFDQIEAAIKRGAE